MMLSRTTLPISAFDSSLVGAPSIDLLLRYPCALDPAGLEEAFRLTLEEFNVFASRLRRTEAGEYELVYDSSAPTFEARDVDDVWSSDDLQHTLSFLDRVKSLPGESLCSVKVSQTADVTVVGLSASHVVTDGIGLYLFMRAWAAASRGEPVPRVSDLHRFLPPTRQKPIAADSLRIPLQDLGEEIGVRMASREAKSHFRRKFFAQNALARLTAEARRDCERGITASDIVAAHLLRRLCADFVPDREYLNLLLPVDIRGIHPDVPLDYVGNAFSLPSQRFEKEELLMEPLGRVAEQIHCLVAEAAERDRVMAGFEIGSCGVSPKELDWRDGQIVDPEADVVISNVRKVRIDQLALGGALPNSLIAPLPAPSGAVVLPFGSGVEVQCVSKTPFPATSLD